MPEIAPEEKWQTRMVRPPLNRLDRLPELGLPDLSRLPWLNRPVRPADLGDVLRDVMLSRENMLEDVNYKKVVPNQFIIEVSETNYARQFRPIEGQVIKQWQDHLLESLVTANSRQGRKEFRFGGRLRLEVRPAAELKDPEARILSRISPDAPVRPKVPTPPSAKPRPQAPLAASGPSQARHPADRQQPAPPEAGRARPAGGAPAPGRRPADGQPNAPQTGSVAYLELVPTGQRWAIYPGVNTIGRSETSQVYLDMPVVQEKRLVSGQHAFIVMDKGVCTLYDGSPDGRPSANGTYVNLRRVPPNGYRLQNGDAIVLAAMDPLYPRSDTPGVVTFYYWTNRGD